MPKPAWPKPVADFYVPLYGGRVCLFTSPDKYSKALEFLQQAPGKPRVAGCARWLRRDDEDMYMVGWFDGKPSTLVHEAGHVALYIAEHVGIKPAASGGEPFCYLLDNLCAGLGIDKLK